MPVVHSMDVFVTTLKTVVSIQIPKLNHEKIHILVHYIFDTQKHHDLHIIHMHMSVLTAVD